MNNNEIYYNSTLAINYNKESLIAPLISAGCDNYYIHYSLQQIYHNFPKLLGNLTTNTTELLPVYQKLLKRFPYYSRFIEPGIVTNPITNQKMMSLVAVAPDNTNSDILIVILDALESSYKLILPHKKVRQVKLFNYQNSSFLIYLSNREIYLVNLLENNITTQAIIPLKLTFPIYLKDTLEYIAPLITDQDLYLVTNVEPLVILDCNLTTGICQPIQSIIDTTDNKSNPDKEDNTINKTKVSFNQNSLIMGTPLYNLNENSYFGFISNKIPIDKETQTLYQDYGKSSYRYETHAIVLEKLANKFKVKFITPGFRFKNMLLEYPCGLEMDNKTFRVVVQINNYNGSIFKTINMM